MFLDRSLENAYFNSLYDWKSEMTFTIVIKPEPSFI